MKAALKDAVPLLEFGEVELVGGVVCTRVAYCLSSTATPTFGCSLDSGKEESLLKKHDYTFGAG